MTETIPVNPDILIWARKSAGLSIDDVVQKLRRVRVTHDVIKKWELGSETPSYPQLERLAYEIYKRPLAVFFFPEPPEEVTARQSFRTLPEYEIENIPSRIRLLLRKAQSFQLNLYELYDEVNPASDKITQDLTFTLSTPIPEMGKIVREYLSITLEEQSAFGGSENAFKVWREKLEKQGLFIFKDAFKQDNFSGFCLYDDDFPVIYVNNSKPFTRQIFTLFHELAHLLFRTGGVDTNIEDYIDYLEGEDHQIEIICNRFAGEFLVPTDDFYQKTYNISVDDDNISNLARYYHVSREVILRKFLDNNVIHSNFYQEKVRSWAENNNTSSSSDGGNYYFTKGAYLGSKYIEKAFSQYYTNRISSERLADYLGVKVKNITGMESLLYGVNSSA